MDALMSYAYVVSYGHEFTDGHWCESCCPAEDRSQCDYCYPPGCPDPDQSTCVDPQETTEDLDCPAHCRVCDTLLDNDLTTDGLQYVAEHVATDEAGNVVGKWAERWATELQNLRWAERRAHILNVLRSR